MRTIRNANITTAAGSNTVLSEERTAVRRVALEINNANAAGGDDMYVSIDEEGAANKGRRIQAGQTITWSMDGGYMPPQGRVNVYCVSASVAIIYEELERL